MWIIWLVPLIVGSFSVFFAQWRSGIMLLKMITTGSILLFVIIDLMLPGAGHASLLFTAGIILALGASMVGDYFLSLGDSTFITGIGGFLFAHAGYLTAFLSLGGFSYTALAVAGGLLAVYLLIFLRPGIGEKVLFFAVSVYVLISILVLSAAFGIQEGPGMVRTLMVVAALLIAFSDSLIAWDKFIRPIPLDQFYILMTYYVAQIAVGCGAWILNGKVL